MLDSWEPFLEDDVRPEDDWCSLILPLVYPNGTLRVDGRYDIKPLGCVAVIDMSHPDPIYKIAAGHKHPGDKSPLYTATREGKGEIGLIFKPEYISYHGSLWRPDPDDDEKGHWSCLFTADIEERGTKLIHPYDVENEEEIPKYFTEKEFTDLLISGGYLPLHQLWLHQANIFRL